jgi:undecaprenyl-diphosphatase
MKPLFGRLRPCHDPEISQLVHLAGSCGGRFGFASGHAANSFGLAMYVWLVFRHRFPWIALLFLWAAMVAFSRVMIGVHYPLDIATGGLTGVFSGWLMFRLTETVYFHFKLEPLIKD